MKKNSQIIIYIVTLLFLIIIIYINKDTTILISNYNNLHTNLPNNLHTILPDALSNPYSPPLRNDSYLVPINVSTNSINTNYRQIGILTPLNDSSTDKILQLMGRPLFVKRDKWQYYTISNQHNNVKLPIIINKKNALNNYGVDQIYTGDVVYVEGYKQSFTATIYENDTIRYLY
jgi:hypothetical protein